MATERITVTRTQPHGDTLLTAIQQLREARERLVYVKAVMETCIDDTDYTLLETVFGVEAGKGTTVYNLLAGINTDLSSFNVTATISRMG